MRVKSRNLQSEEKMRIKIKMRAKIMIMVKKPVVRQEGEGARGLNVHREVVGARPFIA